jgi:peroxin-6
MLKAVTRQANSVDAKIRHLNQTMATHRSTSRNKHNPYGGSVDEKEEEREQESEGMTTAYFFDHFAEPADLAVVVTEADFSAAQDELVPSVSQGELAHYEKVRATFEGTGGDGGGGASSSTGRVDGKGKGKMVMPPPPPAITVGDDGEEEDVAASAAGGTVRRKRDVKGKGKAVMGFQDGTASDDDGLY